jgi:hypothetical protein
MSINLTPKPVTQTTIAKGIHQSDIIIRTALAAALSDLRANPWLLDYVFASLSQDELTCRIYGDKEVTRAKEWFMKTAVPVSMDYRLDDPPPVVVSISLVESVETEATLADIHHDPAEALEAEWPALTAAFTPTYVSATGVVTVPQAIGDGLVIAVGMILVDRNGGQHSITEIRDQYSFVVETGLNVDFYNSIIKSAYPKYVNTVESLAFRERYRIGCHVHGEASKLAWLHSIIVFCLLRYKQDYLEHRGFERTTVTSAPFQSDNAWGKENCYVRYIDITGFVRHYWPKYQSDRILSATIDPLNIGAVGVDNDVFESEQSAIDPAWFAQLPTL